MLVDNAGAAEGRYSVYSGCCVGLQMDYVYFRIGDKLFGSNDWRWSASQVKRTPGVDNVECPVFVAV